MYVRTIPETGVIEVGSLYGPRTDDRKVVFLRFKDSPMEYAMFRDKRELKCFIEDLERAGKSAFGG